MSYLSQASHLSSIIIPELIRHPCPPHSPHPLPFHPHPPLPPSPSPSLCFPYQLLLPLLYLHPSLLLSFLYSVPLLLLLLFLSPLSPAV